MSAPIEEPKVGMIKRLYNWVLQWADSPYGVLALFLIALIESSIFPIPPDVLLLALCLGAPKRSYYFALVCAVGSICGGVLGFYIGALFRETLAQGIIDFYHLGETVARVEGYYRENAFFWIAVAGFTPIPYKAFTITAGFAGIPLYTLIAASALSRTARFMLVASTVYFFGEKARDFIDKYFDILTVAFTVLLIGGIVLLKYIH